MFPVLLQIGPFTIYSLWIFIAFAIFFSLIIVNKLVKYRLVKLSFLAENSLLMFFCGLITARLTFILYNFNYFYHSVISEGNILELFYIWDKGLSAWGALIGFFLSLYILGKKHKENFLAWTDIFTVSILFAMVFIDIGAFLDGSNFGTPTDLPWGILFETSKYAIPIHPVQIYAAIYTLIIASSLMIYFDNRLMERNGTITFLGIQAYSFFRFIEEFFRGDESFMIFDFIRGAQIISLFALFYSSYMLYTYIKTYKIENKI